MHIRKPVLIKPNHNYNKFANAKSSVFYFMQSETHAVVIMHECSLAFSVAIWMQLCCLYSIRKGCSGSTACIIEENLGGCDLVKAVCTGLHKAAAHW